MMEQRSEEWFAARCGSLGASQIADAVGTLKNGQPSATSLNLRAKLVVERLTGQQEEGFTNAAMQWGIDNEDDARRAYSAACGAFVEEMGLAPHPTIQGTHASPDGLVGEDGLVEIKCPNSSTHIDTIKTDKIAKRYLYQMQWQMACLDRQWCDFVSYDPRMPENLRLYVRRVERDDALLAEISEKVIAFLQGVQDDVELLKEK